VGALRYDIADLTPRRGKVKPIGWTAQVPMGIGGRFPWREAWWVEVDLGYTFTFSDALNEVDDNRGSDGFWGLTLGLAFDPSAWQSDPWLAQNRRDLRTKGVPMQQDPDSGLDRDGDGLSDWQETRMYFTNPLMADSDNDGLSDGQEAKRYATDPNRADSDGGGRSDNEELARGSDPLMADDDIQAEVTEPTFHTVFFPSGGTVLSIDAQGVLALSAQLLQKRPKIHLELRGFSDNIGVASSNLRLSRQRAEVVRDYLVSQGIESWRLVVKAWGEDAPLAPNDTAAGRRMNRRVELVAFVVDGVISIG
jgi:outer membrane protein OmpA-like peptidoglycan-associated protein